METAKTDMLTLAAVLGAGTVLGAGVVLSASGVYMYCKFNRTVSRQLEHLSNTIENLRKEIKDLKNSSKPQTVQLKKKKSFSHSTSSFAAYLSAGATSSGDDEFYDLSDDEVDQSGIVLEPDVTLSDLCVKVDKLFTGSGTVKEHAHRLLKQHKEKFSDEAEFVWRLAKSTHLCSLMLDPQSDYEKRKEMSMEARDYGERALKLDDNNSEIHKWFAITLGSTGEFVSMQDRIKDGYTFKEHVVIACEISPNDSTLHHMLGRWCYEVYMLTWIERKVAATLFAAPPDATTEESRNHFFKAEELHPTMWKENKLFIAKTYIAEGDYCSAIEWLDKAASIPTLSDDDNFAHAEVLNLQSRYQSYRL